MWNLILNNGFRLVGLRPCGFLSTQFVGVFHLKILCLIAYLFIISYILVDEIDKLFYSLASLLLRWFGWLSWRLWLLFLTNYCFSLTTLRIFFNWLVGIVIEFVRLVILVVIVIPNISQYTFQVLIIIVFYL